MKTVTVKDLRKQLTKALKDISKLNDKMPIGVIDMTDDYNFCEGVAWGKIIDFNFDVSKCDGKANISIVFSGKPLDDEGEFDEDDKD